MFRASWLIDTDEKLIRLVITHQNSVIKAILLLARLAKCILYEMSKLHEM